MVQFSSEAVMKKGRQSCGMSGSDFFGATTSRVHMWRITSPGADQLWHAGVSTGADWTTSSATRRGGDEEPASSEKGNVQNAVAESRNSSG